MEHATHDTYSDLVIDNYSEVTDKPGVLATLGGRFSVAGTSRNSNDYTINLWKSVIYSDRIQEMLQTKTLFGELSHPPRDAEFLTEVQMNNVSHNITSLSLNESTGEVTGTLDILDTPAGRIANTFIKYGSKLGISSRGVTTTDSNIMTPNNYFLVTWDLVAMPGVAGARLNLVSESLLPTTSNVTTESLQSSIKKAMESQDIEALKIFDSCIKSTNLKDKESLVKVIESYSTEYNQDYNSDTTELNDVGSEVVSKLVANEEPSDKEVEKASEESTDVGDVIGPTATINYLDVAKDLKNLRKSSVEAYDSLEDDDVVDITLNKSQLGELIKLLDEDEVDVTVDTDELSDDEPEATIQVEPSEDTDESDPVDESPISEDTEEMTTRYINDNPDDNSTVSYIASDTLDELLNSVSDLNKKLDETVLAKNTVINKLTTERDNAIAESLKYKKRYENSESSRKVLKESYNSLEIAKNKAIKALSDKNRELLRKSAKSVNESANLKTVTESDKKLIDNLTKKVESLASENKTLRKKLESETGYRQSSISKRQSTFARLAANADLLRVTESNKSSEIDDTTQFVKSVLSKNYSHK